MLKNRANWFSEKTLVKSSEMIFGKTNFNFGKVF